MIGRSDVRWNRQTEMERQSLRMCDRLFLHEPDRGRDRDTGDRIRKQGTPGSEERDRDRRLRVRHRRPVHVCAVICQLQLLYDLCQPGNQLLLLVGL